METTGLPSPSYTVPKFAPQAPMSGNLGGVMPFMNAAAVQEQKKKEMAAEFATQQSAPGIAGLAGHIKEFWGKAERAKLIVQMPMLEALYARRGEYTPQRAKTVPTPRGTRSDPADPSPQSTTSGPSATFPTRSSTSTRPTTGSAS